ncbi:MAG: hypothetical protein PS018_24350 [bacterium]|nr:hypothetical protein [bacterium]
MKRILLATLLFAGFLSAGLLSSPASAQTKVGDWTIEKRSQDDHCNASRDYTDKDDDGNAYIIVLSHSKENLVIAIVYEGWEWDKVGQVLTADVGTNDKDVAKKAKWEVVDKTAIRGIFEYNEKIMGVLSKANMLSIDFADDDDNSIEIKIPRAGEALAALKFCEENKK